MVSNTKIIFFDIDGTLIDMKRKQISGKTMEMLKRLKEKGVMICIATERLQRFPRLAILHLMCI